MGGLTPADLPWDVVQGIREELARAARDRREEDYHVPCFLPDLVVAANHRQRHIKLALCSPVLVAGDMSGSMQVCVMSSAIIASLITGMAQAELVFFNNRAIVPEQPKDCQSAVQL